MAEQKSMHGLWRSRWLFILAATGSAVGLGNIWKFPYIAGENGGGAFVLVYLLCICLIGIPVMIAEVTLGRLGRQSPINTMHALVKDQGAPKFWGGIGWMGAIAGFLILSFYSVIAGWSLAYVIRMAGGVFDGATSDSVGATFGDLLANPEALLGWHTIFMVLTIGIVSRGVNKGLEKAISVLMPMLFLILLLLLGYSMSTEGFGLGINFMFSFDFSKINNESIIVALGHAFFTLSLGMGAIMAYGAYMPQKASVGKTVLMVAGLDTLIAIIAGLVIFPIVFTNGLEAGAGPGLLFQTLPLAFSQMPAGTLFGTLFFLLVAFAALSSAISLAEPVVAWAVESKGMSRVSAATWIGIIIWLLGIGSLLSFNLWAEYTLFGKNFFDVLDFLTANIMLPLGGLLIAVFVGWVMNGKDVQEEVRMESPLMYTVWRFILKFIAPVAVVIVLVNGLIPS
ncbi:sodium-dependent transporter [Oceaniserpentilla sp. 4NH20-0058]|uniref:sodium-dependent transporter n=1 Tax=Oceaniserpentilla sp. 4NH20-0058 TaxID=3127660 RepID=UPI003104C681